MMCRTTTITILRMMMKKTKNDDANIPVIENKEIEKWGG
jgi:hypothetical protein